MGLIQCFEAHDVLGYDSAWDANNLGPATDRIAPNRMFNRLNSTFPYPPSFNGDLISGGRVYSEELASINTTFKRPCALWNSGGMVGFPGYVLSDQQQQKNAVPVINVFGLCRSIYFDNLLSDIAWWVITSSNGERALQGVNPVITRNPMNSAGTPDGNYPPVVPITGDDVSAADTVFTWEHNRQNLWAFGPYEDLTHGGPYNRSGNNYGQVSAGTDGSTPANIIDWSDYGLASNTADFAIDRANDRVFVRLDVVGWDVGKVAIYKFTDKSFVANIWAPNTTNGIIPTGGLGAGDDGLVYIVDTYGWILQYDYNGNFWGAVRNNRDPVIGGIAYGWDSEFKRLLMLEGTASNTDGSSTLRVKAFLPLMNPSYLSKSIPNTKPRKNRLSYFYTNLSGAGGLPLDSHTIVRTLPLGGGLYEDVDQKVTDYQGDVVHNITPASTTAIDVAVYVTVTTSVTIQSDDTIPTVSTVLNVANTDGFKSVGDLVVLTDAGEQTISYTAKTKTQFTFCSGLGTGRVFQGNWVRQ